MGDRRCWNSGRQRHYEWHPPPQPCLQRIPVPWNRAFCFFTACLRSFKHPFHEEMTSNKHQCDGEPPRWCFLFYKKLYMFYKSLCLFYRTESRFYKILDMGYKSEDIGTKGLRMVYKTLQSLEKNPGACYKTIRVCDKIQRYFYKSSDSCYKTITQLLSAPGTVCRLQIIPSSPAPIGNLALAVCVLRRLCRTNHHQPLNGIYKKIYKTCGDFMHIPIQSMHRKSAKLCWLAGGTTISLSKT